MLLLTLNRINQSAEPQLGFEGPLPGPAGTRKRLKASTQTGYLLVLLELSWVSKQNRPSSLPHSRGEEAGEEAGGRQMCRGVELISITSNWLRKRQKVAFRSRSRPRGTSLWGPRAARSLHSEGVAAVDSAHVPHHDPVVVGAGWETGSEGVRPSRLQTRFQGRGTY